MIRDYDIADLPGVQELLLSEGWGARVEDPVRLAATIDAATRAVVSEVDGVVVGFGRSVSDGVSNGYLSMVVVAPDHRRQGHGAAIVRALMGEATGMTWVLRAGHAGSEPFWRRLGFVRSEIAFERPRADP